MAHIDARATATGRSWDAIREWAPARQAGVLGVIFVASYLLVFFLLPGVPPEVDAPAPEMHAYLADNRTLVLAHIVLAGLVFGILLPAFAVALYRATESGEAGPWRLLALIGAILVMAVTVAGGGVFMLAGAFLISTGLSDEVARVLVSADLLAYSVMAPWGFGLFALASAMALRGAGLIPAWLWGAGLAVSLLLPVGSTWVFGDATGPMAYVSFAGILLWAAWVLVASASMSRAAATDGRGTA
jgi:hypothetical protein